MCVVHPESHERRTFPKKGNSLQERHVANDPTREPGAHTCPVPTLLTVAALAPLPPRQQGWWTSEVGSWDVLEQLTLRAGPGSRRGKSVLLGEGSVWSSPPTQTLSARASLHCGGPPSRGGLHLRGPPPTAKIRSRADQLLGTVLSTLSQSSHSILVQAP